MNALIQQFDLTQPKVPDEVRAEVHSAIDALTDGKIRVCDPGNDYEVQTWVKKAILIYFKMQKMEEMPCPPFSFLDKVPLRQWNSSTSVRAVPGAIVRAGAFVGQGTVLMPSFVNIGAHVGSSSMVDTWATVGSCAQVGNHVHLSGGVGLGGVLEPVQAKPTIIEDNVFVGSRAIIVEGVRVRKFAVIGAGVVLTASTKIIDVTGPTEKIYRGEVPEGSVVISGSLPKKFPAGEYQVPCALIIGQRSTQTDAKVSLNQILHDHQVPI